MQHNLFLFWRIAHHACIALGKTVALVTYHWAVLSWPGHLSGPSVDSCRPLWTGADLHGLWWTLADCHRPPAIIACANAQALFLLAEFPSHRSCEYASGRKIIENVSLFMYRGWDFFFVRAHLGFCVVLCTHTFGQKLMAKVSLGTYPRCNSNMQHIRFWRAILCACHAHILLHKI